jgi:predicted Zn-dependent protease
MAHEMRALSWAAGGDPRRAEAEQRDLLKLLPGDAMARVELGRLLLIERKDEEALKVLEEAVRLAPKSVLANLYLGRALYRNYETKRAVAALRTAIEVSPGEVEPQLVLAEVLGDTERAAEAETMLRTALQGGPPHPGALLQLGNLLVRGGKAEEGMKLLAQAAELAAYEPSLAHIPLGYARALDLAHKVSEAEEVYRRVTRQDPENAQAFYYLAQMLLRVGRTEDAQLVLNGAFRVKVLSDEMVAALRGLQLRINEKVGG